MSIFWSGVRVPADDAAQAALRRSLGLPHLATPLPDPARLNRAADAALRQLRTAAVAEAGFAWLLAPRVAMGLMAMAIVGGAVGASWPVTPASATTDMFALLDNPNAIPADLSP
jgi:hypothetical protein